MSRLYSVDSTLGKWEHRTVPSFIALMNNRDTCYCPLCGSKIIMPMSAVDKGLAMEPKNACCRSWVDTMRSIDLEQHSGRAFPSETALLVLEALLEGRRMSEKRSIVATSQHPRTQIGASTARHLVRMYTPASVVRYLRMLERMRSKGLTED